MKLNELMEKYGDYEVKEGFMGFLEKPKPKSVWDLEEGDKYYFISGAGTIVSSIFQNNLNANMRSKIGNVFLTEEDAGYTRERLIVIDELKRYAKEFSDEEWKSGCQKYEIILDNRSLNNRKVTVTVTAVYYLKGFCLYFESEEKAKEAIKAVGEERIKKYYFGVKE